VRRCNAGSSAKVVPIIRVDLHYLEPGTYGVKRKNGKRGSHNGPAC
jgi:hypothetical protein